jgi:hypothetical protein
MHLEQWTTLRLVLACLTILALGGCPAGADDDDDAVDDDDSTDACSDEDEPDVGFDVEMDDELHADNQFFVDLDGLVTDHTGEIAWDWMMTRATPVPIITLAPDAEVANLGPAGFHDVELAPTDGYGTEGTFETDWQDGGSGPDPAGFAMAENIYVVHTGGDRFAKVEITHAQGGHIIWRAYVQDDPGSCNLRTEE